MAIKRILSGLAVGILLAVNVPSIALAATNAEVFTATDAGAAYLANNQQADGSVAGFGGESDWSAIAIAAGDGQPTTFAHNGSVALTTFLTADVPGATTPVTALERKILAITAVQGDTVAYGGTNYNALLAAAHNAGQIGDPTLLNDDIFGIIAIAATQDDTLVPVAQDALDYLLGHQASNGGFSYTTTTCAFCGPDSNDTAAAIVAFKAAEDLGLDNAGLAAAQTAAVSFLLSLQQGDGGFPSDAASPSDGSSTAWSLMALNVLGDEASDEASAAQEWLLANQNIDGGFSYGAYGYTTSDTFTTAHAIIALLGTSWLLDPAAITRPAATGPTTVTVAPATSAGQTPATSATHKKTNYQATTAASQTSEEAVLGADTTVATSNPKQQQATDSPEEKTTNKPVTMAATTSRTQYVGYGLLVLAIVGFIGYLLRTRHSNHAE